MNVLTKYLDEQEKDLTIIFEYFKEFNLLIPYNNNVIVDKTIKEKKILLLYTERSQIEDNIKYTELKRMKLDKIIKDIYLKDNYSSININPNKQDFLLDKQLINIYIKYLEMTK